MRSKLAGLIGIFTVALVLGLGAVQATAPVQAGSTDVPAGHHVLAEDKGPAVIRP
ncbi:hypothetical protein [Streptomyces sp. NPDC059957]|uniref:hypothetical protein n=1 Tax=unclassified Streptomyces TaxID=2593676 RepID=UPI0036544B92